MTWHVVLFSLGALLRVGVHFGILVYAISKRHRNPRASNLIIIAALMLLAADVAGQAIQFAGARFLNPNSIAVFFGITSIVMTVVSLGAVVLMVMAAYVNSNRGTMEGEMNPPYAPTDLSRSPQETDNPFQPPS